MYILQVSVLLLNLLSFETKSQKDVEVYRNQQKLLEYEKHRMENNLKKVYKDFRFKTIASNNSNSANLSYAKDNYRFKSISSRKHANKYGREMIEKRELEDIRRHSRLQSQLKRNKRSHNSHWLTNKKIKKMQQDADNQMRNNTNSHRSKRSRIYHHKPSVYNAANSFIQLALNVKRRTTIKRSGKFNMKEFKNKFAAHSSLKKYAKIRNSSLKAPKDKKTKRRLNNSEAVKRGVAKIFKGVRHHRRKFSYRKNNRKSNKNPKSIQPRRSYLQVGKSKLARRFNKYRRYRLKKNKVRFHPSKKYLKFRQQMKKRASLVKHSNKNTKKMRFKQDSFEKFEKIVDTHMKIQEKEH